MLPSRGTTKHSTGDIYYIINNEVSPPVQLTWSFIALVLISVQAYNNARDYIVAHLGVRHRKSSNHQNAPGGRSCYVYDSRKVTEYAHA